MDGLLLEVKENVNGVKRWQKVSGNQESPALRRRAASPARPTSRPANRKAPSTTRRTASPTRYRAATDITTCDFVIVTIGALATSLLNRGVPTSTLTNASRSARVTIGAIVPGRPELDTHDPNGLLTLKNVGTSAMYGNVVIDLHANRAPIGCAFDFVQKLIAISKRGGKWSEDFDWYHMKNMYITDSALCMEFD
jgi:hypothetical protein